MGEKRNSITALQQNRETLLMRYPSEDKTAGSRGGPTVIKKPNYDHLLNYTQNTTAASSVLTKDV